MRRLVAIAVSGLLAAAAAGAANAAEVSVSVGPELQRHTRAYGPREVDMLRDELRTTVERALAKAGAAAPQRVELVLEAATPNRPTFNELSAATGLSLSSIGVGGAAITGQVTAADGQTRPISYRWYETDLRNVIGYGTWTDAEHAFDRLANQLARGKAPDAGPFRPDLQQAAAFDRYNRLR